MSKRTPTRYTPEQRKAQAEALHATLTEQVKALTDSDTWMNFLRMTASFHAYSLNNLMLILAQFSQASAVCGFRQWQERGRQVRKGEKGIKIRGFSTKKITTTDPITGEEIEDKIARFPILTVFDISQTDPIEGFDQEHALVRPCERLTGDHDNGLYTLGAEWLTNQAIPLLRANIQDATNGYTELGENGQAARVVVDSKLDPAHAAKTLIHEIAHIVLGHVTSGIDEYHAHRGVCETEAESVAFVIAGMAGLDTSAYSVGYVANWSQGDPDTLRETAQRVLTAVHTVAEAFWPTPSTDAASAA